MTIDHREPPKVQCPVCRGEGQCPCSGPEEEEADEDDEWVRRYDPPDWGDDEEPDDFDPDSPDEAARDAEPPAELPPHREPWNTDDA